MNQRLSFIGRQLSRYLLTERDTDAALNKVSQTLHPSFNRELAFVRDTLALPSLELRGDPQTDAPRLAVRLIRHLKEAGATPTEEVLTGLERQQTALNISLDTSSVHFANTLLISIATGLVACVAGVIYVVFVLPQLAAFYSSVDAELPRLTRMLLESGWLWAIALPIALLLLAGLAFAGQISKRPFRWRKHMSLLSRWSPFGRDIARRYQLLMFLIYTRGLVAGGFNDRSALSIAARELGLEGANEQGDLARTTLRSDPYSLLMYSLESANGIGFLPQELDAQWAQQNAALIAAVQQRQSRVNMAIRIAMYAGVATLVIAMYLPIFKLGTVF